MSFLSPPFCLPFFLNFHILTNTFLQPLKTIVSMKNQTQCTPFRILSLFSKDRGCSSSGRLVFYNCAVAVSLLLSESILVSYLHCKIQYVCVGQHICADIRASGWSQEAGGWSSSAALILTHRFLLVSWMGTVQWFGLSLPICVMGFVITAFTCLMVRMK